MKSKAGLSNLNLLLEITAGYCVKQNGYSEGSKR
jgi:hypothetical protein